MAALKKIGRFYYIAFSKVVGEKRIWSTKSLGITHKDMAEKAQDLLEIIYLPATKGRREIGPCQIEYFN